MEKAVYFDLDNTLIHRNKSIELYAEKFLEDFSGVLPDVGVKEIAAVIYAHDNGGYLAINSSYKTIKDAVSHELHKLFLRGSGANAEDVRRHWINGFPDCAIPMSGADDLLSYLSGNGYHVGVISNGADTSRKSTVRGLASFSHIKQLVSSESAGVSKPEPEIFINTALEAGFTPDQCWFIGDHPVNDIHGARRAGMQTIWLRGFHEWPEALEMPTHSIETLAEAKPVLVSNSNNHRQSEAKNARLL
jgi:putative hydrolase of the HAD superfamily